MKLISNNHYTLIKLEKSKNLKSLIKFLNAPKSKNNNLIIDILDCDIDHNSIVQSLLPFHFIWQKRNNSFILVSNISKKNLNDLISISTLEEALDFFHMEQLTRNI